MFQFNTDLLKPESSFQRKPLNFDVITVPERTTNLDTVTEVCQIQRMVNANNMLFRQGNPPPNAIPLEITKSIFFTGYMISAEMVEKLRGLIKDQPNRPRSNVHLMATNILITTRTASHAVLKTGGWSGSQDDLARHWCGLV